MRALLGGVGEALQALRARARARSAPAPEAARLGAELDAVERRFRTEGPAAGLLAFLSFVRENHQSLGGAPPAGAEARVP